MATGDFAGTVEFPTQMVVDVQGTVPVTNEAGGIPLLVKMQDSVTVKLGRQVWEHLILPEKGSMDEIKTGLEALAATDPGWELVQILEVNSKWRVFLKRPTP
jgi:hypothetical protein